MARNDMFSWLRGKKKKHVQQDLEAPEPPVNGEPASNGAVGAKLAANADQLAGAIPAADGAGDDRTVPDVATMPRVATGLNAGVAAPAPAKMPTGEAEAATVHEAAPPEPPQKPEDKAAAEVVPVAAEPASEPAPLEIEAAPEPAPATAEMAAVPEAAPAPVEVAAETGLAAGPTAEAAAESRPAPTSGGVAAGANAVADRHSRRRLMQQEPASERAPTEGMCVKLRAGRKLNDAVIETVRANGRRIFVSLPGDPLRRPFTLRHDGSYRLEGSPDKSQPLIEISSPKSGDKGARGGIQSCRPLRYVKRRRSPRVNFLHGGRSAVRARDKAMAFGQGSFTGRRPVTMGPMRTAKRSKARSRMPSSSR